MKRDMELVREILLAIESRESSAADEIEIDGYSEPQVMYHIKLLSDGGYIEAEDASGNGSNELYYIVEGLTWQGHEFLDAIRNETVWRQTKKIVRDKGGSIPLEVMKALAIELAKKLVGL